MAKNHQSKYLRVGLVPLIALSFVLAPLDLKSQDSSERGYETAPALDEETRELMQAREALESMDDFSEPGSIIPAKKKKKKIFSTSEAFVAGPDWEFDGFVMAAQLDEVKSMFVTNDVIYINMGRAQGLEPGDRISIYRKGDKIRDPRNRRFLGFEVRRTAVAEITDKIDDDTSAARILKANEGVEIRDLVRIGQ